MSRRSAVRSTDASHPHPSSLWTTTSSASRTSESNRQYINVANVGRNDCAALVPMNYPNRRLRKIYAHAELRELKDDTDLARRLASPGYKAKVERAVLVRLELPATHHAALHRARVGACARAGQVAYCRLGKRDDGAQGHQFLPGQRGESGAAEDEVRDT